MRSRRHPQSGCELPSPDGFSHSWKSWRSLQLQSCFNLIALIVPASEKFRHCQRKPLLTNRNQLKGPVRLANEVARPRGIASKNRRQVEDSSHRCDRPHALDSVCAGINIHSFTSQKADECLAAIPRKFRCEAARCRNRSDNGNARRQRLLHHLE